MKRVSKLTFHICVKKIVSSSLAQLRKLSFKNQYFNYIKILTEMGNLSHSIVAVFPFSVRREIKSEGFA
jgi:hypothetical protein